MARRPRGAATIAPRKTIIEWIDIDNGDPTDNLAPSCSAQVQALHAVIRPVSGESTAEPLQPPTGLHLAPLG